ncbi:hypothetical protein HanPSC8_Chr06g0251921 [Helianthus annuus]|nr:hypothetical protein HanPSC8_Chr06g0251921 [Helianthus annuus]
MLTLYLTWLTTLIVTMSSSLATIVGPGKRPLTVTICLLLQSFVVLVITTCMHYNNNRLNI